MSPEIPLPEILSEVLYEYDEQNRLTRITYLDPAASGVAFTLDDDDHPAAAHDRADSDPALGVGLAFAGGAGRVVPTAIIGTTGTAAAKAPARGQVNTNELMGVDDRHYENRRTRFPSSRP